MSTKRQKTVESTSSASPSVSALNGFLAPRRDDRDALNLSPAQLQILRCYDTSSTVAAPTLGEVGLKLGKSRVTVYMMVKTLIRKQMIERVEGQRHRCYALTTQAKLLLHPPTTACPNCGHLLQR